MHRPEALRRLFLALLLLLLAAPALAALPDHSEVVPTGPPARLTPFEPAVQASLTASSDAFWRLQQLEEGTWFVRWDPATRRPRTLLPPGIPWAAGDAIQQARQLIARQADLLGVDPDRLVLRRDSRSGEVRYLVFGQEHGGLEVDGAGVELRLRRVAGTERLFLVRNRSVSVGNLDTTPTVSREQALYATLAEVAPEPAEVVDPGRLVVFADPAGPIPRPRLAWRSRVLVPGAHRDLVTWIDAHTGELLHRYDDVRADVGGTLQVEYEERTVDDPILVGPAPWMEVTGPASTVTTDDLGAWTMAGDPTDVTAVMQGPTILLLDDQPVASSPAEATFTADSLAADFTWTGDHASLPARDALVHFEEVRDWTEWRWPSLTWLPEQVTVTVNVSDFCNAYYWAGSIQFLRPNAGWGCVNFARVADIMYHEYGHGIHDYILQTGIFDGTVSEGSADYVSATIWDDPYMAIGAYGPGTWIREIDTDKVYPTDLQGEVHADGLIWASAMWHLREELIALYGYEDGVETADLLFLGALQGGPTLTDLFEELVAADDDNGDLTDGTPHLCLIAEVLDEHGIGSGPLGWFLYDHAPLPDQPTSALSYPVDATFVLAASTCSGFDTSQVRVQHAANPAGPFDVVPMTWDGATGYSAGIPRYPTGTTVYYYLSAGAADEFTSHGGDTEQLYRFYVGDLDIIFCDDMESGAVDWTPGTGDPANPDADPGDWELGPPLGFGGDPGQAWSGSNVWGTDLGGDDGRYTNLTSQFLTLAPQSVAGYETVLLRYRRWLTVEDGLYDHARVFANSSLVWENGMTSGGTNHHVDNAWIVHELDVSDRVDVDDMLTLTWLLESDPGLELGGWNLDDVCLVAPQDLEPLYVVADFEASDGEEGQSTLSWTQPPVLPLWAVAVVRHGDHYPVDLDDGVVVHLDTSPAWGEAVEIVDPKLEAGRTYYYRVFAADQEWSWKGDLVEGGNADTGTTMAFEDDDDSAWPDDDDVQPDDDDSATQPDDDDTTEQPDDDDTTEQPDDDDSVGTGLGGEGDCACDSVGPTQGAGLGGLLVLLGGALIRRRRS